MPPVNLLHLTLSMGAGGIENLILTMARHIDKKKFKMSVGCLDSGGVLLEEIEALGCETFVLSRKAGVDFKLIAQLAKIFRRKKIHIVNTHNQAAHFYGCLAGFLARTPVVINTEHSRHYIDGRWRRRFEKKVLSFLTDKIVTVSEELKQQSIVKDHISKHKIDVILNGIDLDPYSDKSLSGRCFDRPALFESLDMPKDRAVIGIIGRLHPVKNHELLFRAVQSILRKHGQPVSLLVVGDGELKADLVRLSEQLSIADNVYFVGYRKDIPELLSIIDVLVLCSHTEGLPLTLLEAMAAKVPVVVTNGANKSRIIQHGKNGLVAYATVDSLAKIIMRILNDKVKMHLISSARNLVFNKYSIGATINQYQLLYERILNGW